MSRPTIEGWTGWTPGKVLLAVLVGLSFLVWVYAYSGRADRVPLDTLDDPSYSVAAEAICVESKDALADVPGAHQAETHRERADQIRQADAILSDMLSQLRSLADAPEVKVSERDRGIIDLWLDRWDTILADREDFADRIDEDPKAVFYISAEAGRRAEASIDYVADVNRMPSCGAPTDVG